MCIIKFAENPVKCLKCSYYSLDTYINAMIHPLTQLTAYQQGDIFADAWLTLLTLSCRLSSFVFQTFNRVLRKYLI